MTEAASNANLLEFAKRLLAAFPGPAGPLFAENDPRVNGDKEPSERTSTISRQAVVLNPRKIKHLQEDQQLKEEQKMNITYHEENGYLLPNIVVGCDTSRPIGKYGRMRRKYLQEHRPILFSVMVQDGTLFEHLAEVEDAAQSRLETIVPALAKAAGATEALKAAYPMKWVGIMNACKAQAEEVILQEIFYA